jgi:hypothetical protein
MHHPEPEKNLAIRAGFMIFSRCQLGLFRDRNGKKDKEEILAQ